MVERALMIYADLQGRWFKAEDRFTSNVLGLLSLLPVRDILEFLMLARTRRNKKIAIPIEPQITLRIDYWPYLPRPRICIPDAILTIEKSSSPDFKLLLEIKIGADQTGDQLSNYWSAASTLYPGRFALIYLTDDRSIPKEELEESERCAGVSAEIYWLNWYSLFLWSQRKISNGPWRPYSQ